jgi:hypothetical protein
LLVRGIVICCSIAFLSFGLQEPATLSFCTGLLLAFFGVGQILMYLKNPDLFDSEAGH